MTHNSWVKNYRFRDRKLGFAYSKLQFQSGLSSLFIQSVLLKYSLIIFSKIAIFSQNSIFEFC